MTLRVTFGIDPGLGGGIAVVVDGKPMELLDMPTMSDGSHRAIDSARLAALFRDVRAQHAGAVFACCLEWVQAMPTDGRTSAFRFGEGFGKVKAVLETMGIPYRLVVPTVWKRHYGLLKTNKAAARQMARDKWPALDDLLRRVKDDGRADALLIAMHYEAKWLGDS